jgi:hypothetical protein
MYCLELNSNYLSKAPNSLTNCLGYDTLNTKLVNTYRKVRDTMDTMVKVLVGYPAVDYIVIAIATEYNEFFMTYHKGFLPAHARYEFESLDALLEAMKEIAAFSDCRDVLYEED